MNLSNKTYDVLKFIAMVVLPALAALYLGFGQIWDWPETEKVAASIVLFDTFLGTILQIDSVKYKNDPSRMDGFLTANGVNEDTGIPNLQLVITTPPEDLLSKDAARLRIGDPPKS